MTHTLPIAIPTSQCWKKLIFQKACSRKWIGGLDHPLDGRITLSSSAFVVEFVSLRDSGNLITISTFDTPEGRLLESLLAYDRTLIMCSINLCSSVKILGDDSPQKLVVGSISCVMRPTNYESVVRDI